MFYLILLIVYTIQFTINVDQITCQCFDIPQEDVCKETQFCKWFEESCQQLDCTDATDQDWCDEILPNSYKCVWNQGKCEKFTQCSNYIVSQPQDCFEKWFCIDDGVTANGLYTCKDQNPDDDDGDENKEVVCDKETSDEGCIGIQSNGEYCIWDKTNQNCTSKSITSCQDASNTTEEYCKTAACKWDDTTQECNDQSCDSFKTEKECNFYFSFDFSQVTNCLWNSTACIDFELTDLEPEQCLNMTLNTYVWNSVQSRCVQCAQSQILSFIVLLFLVQI